MSGGISAIKGFDYQSTVILDLIFDHFEHHGADASVRPEGDDDLDLIWTVNGDEQRQLVQVKKPTEDNLGNLNPRPWSLSDVAQQLLGDALSRLATPGIRGQTWVLGDGVKSEVRTLLGAASAAPALCPTLYWKAVHLVSRSAAVENFKADDRTRLLRWTVPVDLGGDPASALDDLVAAFGGELRKLPKGDAAQLAYAARARDVHTNLPATLANITLAADFGTENTVADRVKARLEKHFNLPPDVVEYALFRNLRGFISDVSKRVGRRFDRGELEDEIQSVWPQMNALSTPPRLGDAHVSRPAVVDRFLGTDASRVVEAVGVSGSGKSLLASEVARRAQAARSDQLVFYAQVRSETRLRNIFVGVGAQLRRFRIPEPFALAVDRSAPDTTIYPVLAKAFGGLPQPALLLLDLVEGAAGVGFAHDLAAFLRELPSGSFQVAILGQESPLQNLSATDRDALGVTRVDMPGFDYEEFVRLVTYRHPSAVRGELYEIFQTITAGRIAGLVAVEADSLARLESVAAMQALAARSAEDRLQAADALRFGRLSQGARGAAERLLCFTLPFRRDDAESIFPDENIGFALAELHSFGLVRSTDDGLFEMHETIRQGLESQIAPSVREAAHMALAGWYGGRGVVSAQVYHLTRANRADEADALAASRIRSGFDWSALGQFAARRRLITPIELWNIALTVPSLQDAYLLPDLLDQLGWSPPLSDLLDDLRRRPDLLNGEFNRSIALCRLVLRLEPEGLAPLIEIALAATTADDRKREDALRAITSAARREIKTLSTATLNRLKAQPDSVKSELLSLFLHDGRRDALAVAFAVMSAEAPATGSERRRRFFSGTSELALSDRASVIEVLAALPATPPAAVFRSRSPLFGTLTNLFWKNRAALRAECASILRGAQEPTAILQASLRLLILFAEPKLGELCEPFLLTHGPLSDLAWATAGVAPWAFDAATYEARLMDPWLSLADRALALRVLGVLGADIGALLARIQAAEGDADATFWRAQRLLIALLLPFPEAVNDLLEFASEGSDPRPGVAAISALAQLPGPEVTAGLAALVKSSAAEVRVAAANALADRRAADAISPLVGELAYADAVTAGQIARALTASDAPGSSLAPRASEPRVAMWWAISAGRRRDETAGPRLAQIAMDTNQDWRLRRLAINAAGRLPFDVALKAIHPTLMRETSPLKLDTTIHGSFQRGVAILMRGGLDRVAATSAASRANFVPFAAQLLDQLAGDSFGFNTPGLSQMVAAWLFNRLTLHGWPGNPTAGMRVEREIHTPLLQLAVLRALRLQGRADLIEVAISKATTPWFAAKALQQAFYLAGVDPGRHDALDGALARSRFAKDDRLKRILAEHRPRDPAAMAEPPPPASSTPEAPPFAITFEMARASLLGEPLRIAAGASVTLRRLSSDELEELAALADPLMDRRQGVTRYFGDLHLTAHGAARTRLATTHTGGMTSDAELLRPLIAAGNYGGVALSWHKARLQPPYASAYVERYVAALAAQGDADRFYEALAADEDQLFPFVISLGGIKHIQRFIDDRMVPIIEQYAAAGPDSLFGDLCAASLCVTTPAIDRVLARLLTRWAGRFDAFTASDLDADRIPLWQGFNQLKRHPRFKSIPGWPAAIRGVLLDAKPRLQSHDLERLLAEDRSAYATIEDALIVIDNWACMNHDQLEELDAAADKLFGACR